MIAEFSKERRIRGIDYCGMGGGGGSSGTVDYPAYMQNWHQTMFDNASLQYYYASNPFLYASAFDPTGAIEYMNSAISAFQTRVSELDVSVVTNNVPIAIGMVDTYIFSPTHVLAEIASYNAEVDAELADSTLPRFRRGMQDINAVNSSSFVIGQAIIEAEATRNKNKYASQLRLQNYNSRGTLALEILKDITGVVVSRTDAYRAWTQAVMESSRLSVAMRKEQVDKDIHIDELSQRFKFELLNYMCNIMASIGSASVKTGSESGSNTGALAAAGIGAAATIIAAIIAK